MRVRFYTSTGPGWWPFQVVSLSNGRLPPAGAPHGFYHVIVDNGMFAWWVRGVRPELSVWARRLAVFVRDVVRLRSPGSVVVVVPDWLGDPAFSLRAARDPVVRRLCRDFECMAVAHGDPGVDGYYRVAVELASVDHVSVVGAPLKLPCRPGPGRRPRVSCQVRVASRVCAGAREHGVPCHGLGLLLVPRHVAGLAGVLASFDSSSWTRPHTTRLRKCCPFSAKNKELRERFFAETIRRLLEAGVPLELPERLELEVVGVVGSG